MPQLRVEIVAGAANNQLLEERHGEELEAKGILYAPDYVANAGGVINVYSELAGWTRERSLRKADEIYDTMLGRVRARAREQRHSRRTSPADAGRAAAARQSDSLGRTWPPFPATNGMTRSTDRTSREAEQRGMMHLVASGIAVRLGAALRDARSRDRATHRARDRAPERRARADRERELRVAGRARGDGLAAHEQVRRGAARQAVLRRLRVRRPGRAARDRSREAAVRRRARERAAALGRAGERRRVPRVPQAGRHVPRHGPLERRAPHARLAGQLLRDAVPRRCRTA